MPPNPTFDDKTFNALEALLQGDDAYQVTISLMRSDRAVTD
jgi:hypothetical protein